ncbi:tetratricopeptide repeat protein [Streptococcus oricebi]
MIRKQVKKVSKHNSQKMLLALEEQDLEQANSYFEQALSSDTNEELLDLADYLESIGFFPQAQQIYQKLYPLYPDLALNLASIASDDGDLEGAFAYLEEIASSSPLYPASLLAKADLYQQEGLADVAREKILEASQISDDPLLILALAEINFELGYFQEAIKNYASLDNRLIYQEAGLSTYQRIGLCYANLGKFEAAIEFLEKALELEYDEATLFELALLLADQKEYQRANLYFKQLDTLSPDFEGYEFAYAKSLHAEHQTEQALEMAKQGLQKNPFDSQLLLLASQLSYELHDQKGAEDYLLRAQVEADDLEEVALRLTNLYLEQERYQEILPFEQEELDNVLTRWNIARAHQALENLEQALELFRDLARDLKDNPEFLEQFIYLLRELGQVQEAKSYARSYLDLVPDDVSMQDFYQDL